MTTNAEGQGTDVTDLVQEEREKGARRGIDSKLTEAERTAFYDHSSDRAMAVVLSAIVENHLTELLRLLMRRDEKVARELFRATGPLGPFATKIRIAYMFRILSPETFKDFMTVSRIRNTFAHDLEVVSFDSQPIRDWLENMHIYGIVKNMAKEAQERIDAGTSVNRVKDQIASGFVVSSRSKYRACLRFLIHHIVDQETAIREAEANFSKGS